MDVEIIPEKRICRIFG